MKTYTVQIGNTDDKLSQQMWAKYISWVDMEIKARSQEIHFYGTSPSDSEWQNACWVFDIDNPLDKEIMKKMLRNVASQFNQNSIAWTEGKTEFI